MRKPCDILILTANFGSGHTSVSKAIASYVNQQDPKIRIGIIDMYEVIRPILHTWMYKSFRMLVKYGTDIYNYDYYKKNSSESYHKLHTCKSSLRKLASYLQEVQPSLIISTFPTCTTYVTAYKEAYNDPIPLLTCITDVVKGNEWITFHEEAHYIVPTREVMNSLIQKGIEEDHVLTTGIPIRPEFLQEKDRVALREEQNIEKDDLVILMMGGGLGLIPDTETFYRWIKEHKNLQLYIVTGHNQELYRRINKYAGSNIHILSYTEQIADMMTYADVLISKPGGITLFEALARDLPLIIYKPVLGQEVENSKYIANRGIGKVVHSEKALLEVIEAYIEDASIREDIMRQVAIEKKYMNMEAMVSYILDLYHS